MRLFVVVGAGDAQPGAVIGGVRVAGLGAGKPVGRYEGGEGADHDSWGASSHSNPGTQHYRGC